MLRAGAKVAILSVHAHGDRSFLDDQTLALLSGDLRDAGVDDDLVVAAVGGADPEAAEARLAGALAGYGAVVYERIFRRDLAERLRDALPGTPLVACDGEHALADPPADVVCRGNLRRTVPAALRFLRGEGPPAPGTLVRGPSGLVTAEVVAPPPDVPLSFRPNLRPVLVNPEGLPPTRTFSVTGNAGCPYQADARENPLYEGAAIPDGLGRGCAFCVTGNRHEASPPEVTAARVHEQLAWVRREAPSLDRIVLKDQNPFGWLTELVERCAAEGPTGFTLLLETRADWMLRSEKRLVRALEAAGRAGIVLAPFLVGIESFSQPELDRMNKGIAAETNERFLAAVRGWAAAFPSAFTLAHASFGFVLFTPWTTMADLRVNHAALVRTRFDELRGSILLSRARLYPDTALFHLAARDGLLEASFARPSDDASARYGYYPSHPWRFAAARVGALAALATAATEATGGRDQVRLLGALLEAFDEAGEPSLEEVLVRVSGPAGPRELLERLARLVAPLRLAAPLPGGWRLAAVEPSEGRATLRLLHRAHPAAPLALVPRGGPAGFSRTRHYELSSEQLDGPAREALLALASALARGDR